MWIKLLNFNHGLLIVINLAWPNDSMWDLVHKIYEEFKWSGIWVNQVKSIDFLIISLKKYYNFNIIFLKKSD
jgi:hypothetical protein